MFTRLQRFKFSRKITSGCHLLDPRWNKLFLFICQGVVFYLLGNRTRVPLRAIRGYPYICQKGSPLGPDCYYWHSSSIPKRVKTTLLTYN